MDSYLDQSGWQLQVIAFFLNRGLNRPVTRYNESKRGCKIVKEPRVCPKCIVKVGILLPESLVLFHLFVTCEYDEFVR